ncbi:MAG: hypothetical protein M3Q42_13795 [Pseudomonadota bacterium]|nr:hypothetical protein [Pseudomonadota bacterium]
MRMTSAARSRAQSANVYKSDAKGEQQRMFNDRTLFENAHLQKNSAVTGMNGSWGGHAIDLQALIHQINDMNVLGRMMGCDMSEEERSVKQLFVPFAPWP